MSFVFTYNKKQLFCVPQCNIDTLTVILVLSCYAMFVIVNYEWPIVLGIIDINPHPDLS